MTRTLFYLISIYASGTVQRCKLALLMPLLMAVSMGSTSPAQAADKTIVIKFSHVAAMGTPKSSAIEHFKKLTTLVI